MPMRVAVSPRASMMNGAATCGAAASPAPRSTVRRLKRVDNVRRVMAFLRGIFGVWFFSSNGPLANRMADNPRPVAAIFQVQRSARGAKPRGGRQSLGSDNLHVINLLRHA